MNRVKFALTFVAKYDTHKWQYTNVCITFRWAESRWLCVLLGLCDVIERENSIKHDNHCYLDIFMMGGFFNSYWIDSSENSYIPMSLKHCRRVPRPFTAKKTDKQRRKILLLYKYVRRPYLLMHCGMNTFLVSFMMLT